MSTDLTELNKLEAWLMLHRVQYERKDLPAIYDEKGLNIQLEKHQICVPVENVAERSWDAIANKKLTASVVPAANNRGSTTFVNYDELMQWASTRKKRMTTIPGVATLTIDDLAEELLKRIQHAYEEGYKAGVQAAKQEYLDAIKGVKL